MEAHSELNTWAWRIEDVALMKPPQKHEWWCMTENTSTQYTSRYGNLPICGPYNIY